jgi:hypothetical protein
MDANAIQKLYEVCKVSLSEKGPLSSESLDNVRAVLGKNCLQFLFGSDDDIYNLWNIQPKGCKINMNQEKCVVNLLFFFLLWSYINLSGRHDYPGRCWP